MFYSHRLRYPCGGAVCLSAELHRLQPEHRQGGAELLVPNRRPVLPRHRPVRGEAPQLRKRENFVYNSVSTVCDYSVIEV